MKTFPFPQDDMSQCPICGTSSEGEAVFVPIAGTLSGTNMEACVVHAKCLTSALKYYTLSGAIMGLAKFSHEKT